MENPYAAPELTPELAKEERRRPKMWRALLVAYGVHHGFSVLGLFAGVLVDSSEVRFIFPPHAPWSAVGILVLIPVVDLRLVIEPMMVGGGVPATMFGLRLLRSVFVLTIPVSAIAYAISRRRAVLWYVGVVSLIAYMSFVLTVVLDRRTP
jgi:hypothetical protein